MAGVTAMEVISIGLILPVIQVLLPGQNDSELTTIIFSYLPEAAADKKALWVAGIFAGFFLVKNMLLLLMIFIINKIVAFKTAFYTGKLFRVYLSRSLAFHFRNNSALLLRNATSGINQSLGAVRIALLLGLDLLLMVGALALLIVIEPEATLGAAAVLGVVSLTFFKIGSPVFRRWGERAMILEGSLIRWISQSFNGIRDVKLFHANEYLLNKVGNVAREAADVQSRMETSVQIPRLLIETVVVIGFLGIVLAFAATSRTPQEIISTVGIFGMAALRLMPSLNRILTAATQLRQRAAFIATIHDDLTHMDEISMHSPDGSRQPELPFKHEIRIDNVVYSYPDTEHAVLRGANLTIGKGKSVGFIGSSGAGKSTLMDIILGFLKPESGRILIDGKNAYDNIAGWQKHIGFVPQQVFVMDDTIRRNIAFAVDDENIDDLRIKTVLEMTQLEQFVNDLPEGLDTMLGEHGTRLSGGQRQRVAIARALYHDPDVLVFDEATSALDNVTEQEITRAIETLAGDKTILIVAHRLSTVKNCDQIVFMKDGEIVATGRFDELIKNNPGFAELARLGDLGVEIGNPEPNDA